MHVRLSDRIRAARRLRGCSQAKLAMEMRVDPSTVGHWERGNGSAPKVDRLIAIAQATGVSVEWLATGKGAMRATDTASDVAHALALSRDEERLLRCFRHSGDRSKMLLLDLAEHHADTAR
jgi:transcriptional regulator with XRE-family HTH domain